MWESAIARLCLGDRISWVVLEVSIGIEWAKLGTPGAEHDFEANRQEEKWCEFTERSLEEEESRMCACWEKIMILLTLLLSDSALVLLFL